ncbi:mtor-associated protein meak7 [Anaeramoeba ignava]|uniref:Mtor-associated protein meak7 n=1 Tax=Anaeramoeba ignava TaxID=1746090 RepID=A0A9Q0LZ28_ANAIG|nr:mtor-associated protein meak7 [Anaeramoeba ignava]
MKFKSIIIQEKQHFQKLREWINDDEFFSKMKLGYSAKQDGFSSNNWHLKCDNKGKTLIIIKTKDNFIFGGFTSVGFINEKLKQNQNQNQNPFNQNPFNPNQNPFNQNQNSFNQNQFGQNPFGQNPFNQNQNTFNQNQNPFNPNPFDQNTFGQNPFEEKVIEDIPDSKAFLFSLRNDQNNRKPEKLSIIEGKEKYAIDNNSIDRLAFGKNSNSFGGSYDLSLNSNLKTGYSNLGYIYNLPIEMQIKKENSQNYLAGSYNSWKVQEIETYFI